MTKHKKVNWDFVQDEIEEHLRNKAVNKKWGTDKLNEALSELRELIKTIKEYYNKNKRS